MPKAINFKKLPIDEYIQLYTVLSNANRIRILFALYHDPPSQGTISFSKLEEKLDVNPALLTCHLKILLHGGLVENSLTTQGTFQYRLTKKGYRTVKGMIKELNICRRRAHVQKAS